MFFKVNTVGQKLEIELKGRLTFADYNAFRQITDLIGNVDQQQCVFDLKELEYIDSAGLGMLLLSREKAIECNGFVVLKNPIGQIKKMLELGRFDSLFDIKS